jgi:hypothetical protein
MWLASNGGARDSARQVVDGVLAMVGNIAIVNSGASFDFCLLLPSYMHTDVPAQ